jgi:hypothetical protein
VPATLSPELRLLTQAASPVPVGSGSLLDHSRELEWDVVLRQARRHRLASLLSRHLETAGLDVPSAVVAELSADRQRTAARNLRLLAGSRAIVAAVDQGGVTVMALKGVALLEETYDDLSLRPMVDLDFLVPEASIEQAEDIVVGLGFRSARPRHDGFVGPRAGKYAYPQLTSADGLVHVDLHRHVLPDSGFDIAEYWAHARTSRVGAHLLPDHEDLLVHLAAHFFKDRVRRSAGSLGQLADMAWLAHVRRPDWDVVVARARQYRLHGRVFLALMSTNELLGPIVPPEVLAALRPASYSPSVGRAFLKRRLLADAPWHPSGYFVGVPGEAYSSRWRPLRRMLPDRAYMEAGYGSPAGPGSSYGRLLWVRGRQALGKLRPWHLYRDARLNRWMRTVAEEGTTRTPA